MNRSEAELMQQRNAATIGRTVVKDMPKMTIAGL
jgi:hypothetical protein